MDSILNILNNRILIAVVTGLFILSLARGFARR